MTDQPTGPGASNSDLVGLNRLARSILATLAPDLVLDRAGESLLGLEGIDAVLVNLVRADGTPLASLAPKAGPWAAFEDDPGRVAKALEPVTKQAGLPYFLTDLGGEPDLPAALSQTGLSSLAGFELRIEGVSSGLLLVGTNSGSALDRRTGLLTEAAEIIGQGLSNALAHQDLLDRGNSSGESGGTHSLEDKYRSLINNAVEAIFVVQDDCFVFVNPQTLTLTGYEEHELQGMLSSVIVHPDDQNLVDRRRRARLAGGSPPIRYSIRIVTKKGQAVWVEIRNVMVDWEGRPAVLTFMTDISRRKEYERRLRKSQERYKTISEITSDLSYSFQLDPEGEIRLDWVTGGLTRLTGYSRTELKARGGWPALIHPEDLEIPQHQFEALVQGREKKVEYRIIDKQGQVRWVRDYARPVFDQKEQRTIAIDGAVQDISDWRKALIRLDESRSLFTTFMDNSPGIAFIKDHEGRYTYTNRIWLEMAGLKAEDAYGKTDHDIWPRELAWVYQANDREVRRKGRPLTVVERSQSENEYLEMQVHKFPIRDANGELMIAGYGFNITPQRRAEEEVRKLNQELEKRVHNRTVELERANTRLRREVEDRKRAERNHRESEQRYRDLFDQASDSIYIVDPETMNFLDVNLTAVRQLGYSREEFLEMSIPDVDAPQGDPTRKEKFEEFLKIGHVRFEQFHLRRDGSVVPVEVDSRLIDYGGRKVIQSFARDISERLESERALQAELAINTAISIISEVLIKPGATVEEMAEVILGQALDLTASQHGYVSEVDPASGDNVGHTLTAMMGRDCQIKGSNRKIVFPRGEGGYGRLWGHSLNTQEPFYSNQPTEHPAYGHSLPQGHIPLERFLSVPAVYAGRTLGQISLANSIRDYTAQDLEVIGRLARLYAVALERNRAQESLRQSEERFSEFMTHLPGSAFIKDRKHRVRFCNAAYARIYGSTVEKVLAARDHEFAYPELREEIRREDQEVLNSSQSRRYETKINTPEGTEAQYMVIKFPILQAGKPNFLGGMAIDITDQKEAEAALRESEQLAGTILESSLSGVYIYDIVDEIFVYINPQYTVLTGYTLADLNRLGEGGFSNLLHPDESELTDRYIGRLLAAEDGEVLELEFRFRKADGDWIYSFSRDTVFARDEAGQVTRVLGTFSDVTERRQAEEDLRLAKEEAEAANEAKSQFLANMSHEIRTPMNAVMGMTSLALDSNLEGETREYLETVRTSARDLLGLIDGILDLSRIEAGAMELESVHFDPRTSLGRVVKTLSVQAEKKNLELVFDVSEEMPPCLIGDAGRLRQIIYNLVSNSIKFTPAGRIRVKLSFWPVRPTEILLAILVSDTGIGIPDDKLEKIFDPFSQADASTTREFGGTGLGLAISSQLIEMMGGRISVSSEVGQGTTFRVEVPLALGDPKQLATRCPIPDRSGTGSEAGGISDLRVLVAEDNPVNQKFVEALLKKLGCRVSLVANGREAVAAITEREFDAILMDIQMPEMDGLEATRRIRRLEREGRPRSRIIALTAHAMAGDRQRCLEAGMDDYLSKPIEPEQLTEALKKVRVD